MSEIFAEPVASSECITAEPEHVDEREILAGVLGRVVCRSGTLLLKEGGEPRATMSFSAYIEKDPVMERSIVFVRNGGPSTPTTAANAFILGGPFLLRHSPDGRLDPDRPVRHIPELYSL